MTLTCGGKGPCCHVGYPHRHCEHCDVVIATSYCSCWHGYPHTYWTNTYSQLGNLTHQQAANRLQGLTNMLSDGTQAR